MTNSVKKIILAYSGGLDTSVILRWLIETYKCEVVAFAADLGQEEELSGLDEKARATGASKLYVEDLREEFVQDFVFPALRASAVYEGCYLMGTSLARPLIAKRQIEIAHQEEAMFVSHGSTGKGNDQVRFELTYYALDPLITVLSPWKMPEFLVRFQGRPDMLDYAAQHGIDVKATVSKPYSEDANLIHISHESGVLEDPAVQAGEHVYSWTRSPKEAPDSVNVLDAFLGKRDMGRNELVVEGTQAKMVLRKNEWVFIPPHEGPMINRDTNIELGNSPKPQLYNLSMDIGQIKNVAEEHGDIADKMSSRLDEILKSEWTRSVELEAEKPNKQDAGDA